MTTPETITNTKKVRSVPQFAAEHNMCARTAWKLVHDRKIAVFRTGRKVLITDEAIADFIARNTVPASQPKP